MLFVCYCAVIQNDINFYCLCFSTARRPPSSQTAASLTPALHHITGHRQQALQEGFHFRVTFTFCSSFSEQAKNFFYWTSMTSQQVVESWESLLSLLRPSVLPLPVWQTWGPDENVYVQPVSWLLNPRNSLNLKSVFLPHLYFSVPSCEENRHQPSGTPSRSDPQGYNLETTWWAEYFYRLETLFPEFWASPNLSLVVVCRKRSTGLTDKIFAPKSDLVFQVSLQEN